MTEQPPLVNVRVHCPECGPFSDYVGGPMRLHRYVYSDESGVSHVRMIMVCGDCDYTLWKLPADVEAAMEGRPRLPGFE